MRIAINGRLLIKGKLEGIGYFTWEVLKRMVQTYPEHDYLVLFDRQPAEDFMIPGVEYRVLRPAARHPVLYRLWYDVLVPWYIWRWGADVFVSFDGFTSQYLPIPLVTAIHDLAYLHFPQYMKSTDLGYYQKYQPRFAKLSDRLLTVSHYSAKDLAQQYGIDEKEVNVVYNGSRFEENPPREDAGILTKYSVKAGKYFIYTGSLHPRKNLLRLVQAFEQTSAAENSEMKLVLAGRLAWQTDEFVEWIRKSRVAPQIILTGYVPDNEMWNLLRYSLSLCYVSIFEGFGVPILDAFHAGVPVVCSSTTSIKEVAGDGALLVDPEDTKAISRAMDRIYNEDDLRQGLIDRGNDRKHYFSWEKTTGKVFETIQEVINSEEIF